MHPPRPNTCAAGVVDEGLAMVGLASRYHAAHFMLKHGVAFRVIVRVLASGARVRKAGVECPPGPPAAGP